MPNPSMTLLDLDAALRSIGRGVVFYSDYWDGSADIALTHLGDTEGEISLQPNESFVHLTTPELTGNAKHKSYVEGADPVVTIPLYVADPDLRAILSPHGAASAGYARRRAVTEYTLAIFPEELFFDPSSASYKVLSNVAGVWKLDGAALSSAQAALLGQAVFLWRGYFASPPITLKHAEAGKAVESVTFQVMHDASKPDGNKLYTIGDPGDAAITIDHA